MSLDDKIKQLRIEGKENGFLVQCLIPIIALISTSNRLQNKITKWLSRVQDNTVSTFAKQIALLKIVSHPHVLGKAQIAKYRNWNDPSDRALLKQFQLQYLDVIYPHNQSARRFSRHNGDRVRDHIKTAGDYVRLHIDQSIAIVESQQFLDLRHNHMMRYLDDDIFLPPSSENDSKMDVDGAYEDCKEFEEYLRKFERPVAFTYVNPTHRNFEFKSGRRLVSVIDMLDRRPTVSGINTFSVQMKGAMALLNGNVVDVINDRQSLHRDVSVEQHSRSIESVARHLGKLQVANRHKEMWLLSFDIITTRGHIVLRPATSLDADVYVLLRLQGANLAVYHIVPNHISIGATKAFEIRHFAVAFEIMRMLKNRGYTLTSESWGLYHQCHVLPKDNIVRYADRSFWDFQNDCMITERRPYRQYYGAMRVDTEHIYPDVLDYLTTSGLQKSECKDTGDGHIFVPVDVEFDDFMESEQEQIQRSRDDLNLFVETANTNPAAVVVREPQRMKLWERQTYAFNDKKRTPKSLSAAMKCAEGIRMIGTKRYPLSPLFQVAVANMKALGYDIDEKRLMCAANLYFGPHKRSGLGPHTENKKFAEWLRCISRGEMSWVTVGAKVHGKIGGITAIPMMNGVVTSFKMDGFVMYKHTHNVMQSHLIWREFPFRLSIMLRHTKQEHVDKAKKHKCTRNLVNPLVCSCINASNTPFEIPFKF